MVSINDVSSSDRAGKGASPEQTAANRLNAQKSTGPRTAAGKKASRCNAIRHGLCATMAILPGEDIETFEAFARGIYKSFRPADPAEAVLVDQYVSVSWKLRRLGDAEYALHDEAHQDEIDEAYGQRRGDVFERVIGREAGSTEPAPTEADFTLKPEEHPMAPTAGQLLADELRKGEGPMLKLMALEDRLRRTLARTIREIKELRLLRKIMLEDEEVQPAAKDQPFEVLPFREPGTTLEDLDEEDRQEREAQEAAEKSASVTPAQNEPISERGFGTPARNEANLGSDCAEEAPRRDPRGS